MNRLNKELRNRGIVYDSYDESGYDTYECEEQLVTITDNFIITCFYCNVLEPQYKIYDRHFNFIGQQSSEKEDYFLGDKRTNPWSVGI